MRMEHWWFTARLRLKSILRRSRVEQEMDEELRFHLENKIEEGIANGLSPKEARYAAMRAMDGLEQRKEEMRDMRRIHWLTDFFDDVHYATRSLRRTSGFAAFVVITLALGIGMTSATFSMVDALIFRPYPVPHPSGVVTLVSTTHDSSFDNFSYREYLDIRDKTKSYDGVIASATMEAVGFSAERAATTANQGRNDGFRQLLPRAWRGAAAGSRFSRGRRSGARPRCGSGAGAGFLEARIRERPVRGRHGRFA